ncbi:MAG: cation-translocating P-type ATPase [Planctomycetota bacterium]|nr:cation-translocating P-type ATPase [Planctomycetota bacterium]
MTQTASPNIPQDTSEELRLRITGMSCAGCAAAVQRAVEGQPGVSEASVSVTEAMATISGPSLDAESLIRVIEARGYGAEPLEEAPAPAEVRSEIEFRQIRAERQWRRRAIVGLGLWVPMAILHWTVAAPWVAWVMLIGSTIVLATAGAGFYRSAARAAMRRTTNMDTLISMGATAAYVFSLVVFVSRLLGRDLGQPLYFGEAAALLGIISLGHWLEARASARAGSAVRELLELQPDEAERLDAYGRPETIASGEIRPGDRILVRPGGRVPVDGLVVDGEAEVDESVVTGEALPVRKTRGENTVAGSLNMTGRLVIEADVDGRHTTVSRIARLVQQAQASRADIQRLADRVSAVFVPSVLSIAALTMIGWSIFGSAAEGLIASVTVLIISCPCALGLATPMAVMVGAGAASKRGILVKSAAALERAGVAKRVIFDKTGTLTTGRASVTEINLAGNAASENELLRLAASVEAVSEHPIARAIIQTAYARDIELRPVSGFRALPGEGVRGEVEGRTVQVLRDESASCRVLADDVLLGTLTVSDSPRPDAKEAIERLRALGLSVTMLSGDQRERAEAVGRSLGLDADEVHAEATPESKQALVEEGGAGTIMVGDGINDAAALAQADLGIAIASGTNIAIESADVVIPGDRVAAVPETIDLARRTLQTIKQNLFFAFVYNVAMIPVAALGLLGPHGPLIAAIAMGCSDVTVVGNALRLKARLQPATPEDAPVDALEDAEPARV